MGRRISKEFLHPSILEGVNAKIGNLSELETDAKGNMVQAVNELIDKLDNSAEIEAGKELIANAVGEPLNAEDSFQDMSTDINGLLSTFKTNMMNNGVTVESGDRFKQLIDKIATMVEEGSGKGIQIVSGVIQDYVANTDTFNLFTKDGSNYTYEYASYVEIKDLSFRPSFVFMNAYNEEDGENVHNYAILNNFNTNQYNNEYNKPSVITGYSDVSSIGLGEAATLMADEKVFIDDSTIHVPIKFWSNIGSDIDYLIIGVGEEDTTLRDSLASILQEEGVTVTEEDDMANLITKVDEEFDNKKQELGEALINKGIPVVSYNWEDLISYISLFNNYIEPSADIINIYNRGVKNEAFSVISTGGGITFTEESNHLYIVIPQQAVSYTITLGTESAFDLTEYTNICVNYLSSTGRFALGICKSRTSIMGDCDLVKYYIGESDYGVEKTYKLNISDYNDEYYIILNADAASAYGGSLKIYEIYLEK